MSGDLQTARILSRQSACFRGLYSLLVVAACISAAPHFATEDCVADPADLFASERESIPFYWRWTATLLSADCAGPCTGAVSQQLQPSLVSRCDTHTAASAEAIETRRQRACCCAQTCPRSINLSGCWRSSQHGLSARWPVYPRSYRASPARRKRTASVQVHINLRSYVVTTGLCAFYSSCQQSF